MDEEEIAYHEAGHAVVAVWLGAELLHATLEPDWDDGPARDGDVAVRWHHHGFSQRELLEREVLACLAGPAAEMVYRGEHLRITKMQQWAADWQFADELTSRLIPNAAKRQLFLESVVERLVELFDQPSFWMAIAETAEQLSAHQTIEGEVVVEIVRQWIQ